MKQLPILLLLALAACTSNSREDKTVKTTSDTLPATNTVAATPGKHLSSEDSLQEAFDSLADGACCTYSQTREESKKGKYFFIQNLGVPDGIYLLLNRQIIQLSADSSQTTDRPNVFRGIVRKYRKILKGLRGETRLRDFIYVFVAVACEHIRNETYRFFNAEWDYEKLIV
ncbi:MAG TPA: hypothetical protein VNZ45_10560 [Bacteroidia bacterium]|jgi:hypothetical protein|nr:hypothetical protein [Bacteroidia bacterium]